MKKLVASVGAAIAAVAVLSAQAEPEKYTKDSFVMPDWQAIEAPAYFALSADAIKVVDDETLMGGGAIGSAKPGKAFWPRVENGVLSVQMQLNDGGWIKYEKIQFKTVGTTLYVRACESGRVSSSCGLGCDFDSSAIRAQYYPGTIPTAANNGSYGVAKLVYTIEGASSGLLVAGSPADYGNPDPAYGPVPAAVGDTLVFSAPEGPVTNKPDHQAWTATGWTLKLADGTATSGPEMTKSLTFAEQHNNATLVWNFASSPLPISEWGKSVGGRDYVYLVRGDASKTVGETSCVRGENWSDEAPPRSDRDYLVDLDAAGELIASGNNASVTFAGRSLLLGNPETGAEGRLRLTQTKPFGIRRLDVSKGYIINDPADWCRLQTTNVTLLSGGELKVGMVSDKRLYWRARVNGGADTKIVVTPAGGAKSLAKSAIFTGDCLDGESNQYTFTNFCGQIVVDGTNVVYAPWHGNNGNAFSAFVNGVSDEFRADAIVLRNGGKYEMSSYYSFVADFGNRGITVGEGDGVFRWWVGNGSADIPLNVSFVGEGVVEFPGRATLVYGSCTAAGLRIQTNGVLRLDTTYTLGAKTMLEVANGGRLIGYAKPFAPFKVILRAGATFTAAVADGSRYINHGVAPWQIYRPSGGTVGILTLSPSSVLDLDAGPLKIGLETASYGGFYGNLVPILKVPKSVRVVTEADFEFANDAAGFDTVRIVTEGDMQTVCGVRSKNIYVVPADTEGHVPVEPYDSWETAATSLADAVAMATNNAGTIRLAPGVYRLSETVTVGGREITSDDGTGRICPDRVIIDGGTTPERLGVRPFILDSARSCLRGLTIRNGYASDANSGGGGVYVSAGRATVVDCVITNCCATNAAQTCSGGGLFANECYPRVERTKFLFNLSNAGGGAAVKRADNSWKDMFASREYCAQFIDCEFVSNCAYRVSTDPAGGGFAAAICPTLWFEGTRFCGNYLQRIGGNGSGALGSQMVVSGGCGTVITNCVFENNGWGYRALADGIGPVHMSGCVFRNNSNTMANLVGNGNLTKYVVENTVFSNNVCSLLYSTFVTGGTLLRNCLYVRNDAIIDPKSARFENCTVVSNRYGAFTYSGGTPKFINTIVAFNGKSNINYYYGSPAMYVTHSGSIDAIVVSNCCFEGATGAMNRDKSKSVDPNLLDPNGASFDANPRFRDVAHDDWRLKRRSPCRDMGLLLDGMEEDADLDGLPRVVTDGKTLAENPDALPDMGCYENQDPCPGLLLLVR